MNYKPVTTGNQTNDAASIEINVNAGQARQVKASDHKYMLLLFMPSHSPLFSSIQSSDNKDVDEAPSKGDEGIFDYVNDDREVGAKADTNNLEISTVVSPIPITRVHKDHPKDQIIGDLNLATQTTRMINFSEENDMVKEKDDGIFISQDKYVSDILKKFDFTTIKIASTLIEPNKALIKDAEAKD
nr:ribonuclease H-like domain-containing protein [Tanacetum cinerariifolium]